MDVVCKEVFGMIDFTLLPASNAIDGADVSLSDKKWNYTSMPVSDEMGLYGDSNSMNDRTGL